MRRPIDGLADATVTRLHQTGQPAIKQKGERAVADCDPSRPTLRRSWLATTARQYNLESTVRNLARPSSLLNPPAKLLSFFLQHI